MRRLGFSYYDALLYLSEKYDIELVYDGVNSGSTKDIISLHDELQRSFRYNLYEPIGLEAKEYILGRSFTDSDLEMFGLGYIPSRYDFSSIFRSYDRKILFASGFFKESKSGGFVQSRFFNRLTLPIRSITGSISAFAGRSIDDSMPKYLNSADSEIFHKGELLFNIDKAKDSMRSTGSVLLVEGYFDVMRLYLAGYKNVVAPMGTSLTKSQIALIKRYADDVTIIFDGDEAGLKAAKRSLPLFIESSISPKAVFLPVGEDPDSILLKSGIDHFSKLYEQREDLFIYIAKQSLLGVKEDFNKKLVRFKSIRTLLINISDPIMRDYYVSTVADIFGFKSENIYEDIHIQQESARPYERVSQVTGRNIAVAFECELDFFTALTALDIDMIDELLLDLDSNMFNDVRCGSFFTMLVAELPAMSDIRDIGVKDSDFFFELKSRTLQSDVYRMAIENRDQIIYNSLVAEKNRLIMSQKIVTDQSEAMNIMKKIVEITDKLLRLKN